MTTQEKNGITEGVIWKQLLIFFFPILVGSFFQQLYNTVDSVIVGQFVGKEALSSVGGSAGQIISLVVGFFTGVSTGATVIISQYFGAGKKEEIEESLHTAYAFALVGGLVLGIAGIVFAPQMLLWMNTPEELIAESVLYVRVYFSGLIFIFIYNMGAAILRAVGDSKRPLYYLIVCSVVNYIGSFTHSGHPIRRFRCGHCHPDRSGGQCCFGDSYTDVPHGGHETVSLTDPHVQKNAAEYFKNRSSGGI